MGTAADSLVVRPYAAADRPRLADLLRQVWSYKRDVDRHVDSRWWWQWPEPPLFVVDDPDRGELAGLCAYIPCVVRSRGREATCAWFVDFYVLASQQGRGLGKRLTQAVQARFDVTASLSQTAMAYRVFQKLGWSERSSAHVLMHPMPAPWLFPARPPQIGIDVTPIGASLPHRADLDALWAQLKDAYPLIARRSADDLARRYAPQGDRRYTLVTAARDSGCAGYMIVRVVCPAPGGTRRPVGLIVDALTAPGDTAAFRALLGEAVRVLAADHVSRVFCLATDPAQQTALAARGFLSPETPLVGRWMTGNTKWLTCITNAGAAWVTPAEWYLTLGDCDVDYAWFLD